MKKILYVGNKLNSKKSNISSIGTLGNMLEKEGYSVYYSSSKINKFLRLIDMMRSCWIYRNTVDFVIIDTYSTQNFYYALAVSQWCRLLKLKYIPSLNGGNLPKRLKHSPYLSRMIFRHAYKLVSPSVYLKEVFENQDFKPVYFIPNSIQIDKYKFEEKNFKSVRLLWVRSFSKIYNPQLAVKVLKLLLVDGLNVKLCMVGPDTEDGTMEELKALIQDYQVKVTFTGKLTKKQWVNIAKDYNIFINTTNFDNMPVSVIEAMALGLPIVSTNVGGMPYLLENNKDGLLVPPNDHEAFVVAIKRIVNNPVFSRAMAYNAKEKVEQFDWELLKHKWNDLLK